jgi:hypothetical protein
MQDGDMRDGSYSVKLDTIFDQCWTRLAPRLEQACSHKRMKDGKPRDWVEHSKKVVLFQVVDGIESNAKLAFSETFLATMLEGMTWGSLEASIDAASEKYQTSKCSPSVEKLGSTCAARWAIMHHVSTCRRPASVFAKRQSLMGAELAQQRERLTFVEGQLCASTASRLQEEAAQRKRLAAIEEDVQILKKSRQKEQPTWSRSSSATGSTASPDSFPSYVAPARYERSRSPPTPTVRQQIDTNMLS